MKKTLALLLAALMLFTLAACGGDKTPTDVQTDGETTEATTTTTEAPTIVITISFVFTI